MIKPKFDIQDRQYEFPYHYLVDFSPFNNFKVLSWGWEYFAYVNKVLEIIKINGGKTILDFGCGEGKVTSEIARVRVDSRIKGIDLSSRAILFAKAFNYGGRIEFAEEELNKVSEKFDTVVAVEVFEHIPDNEIGGIFERIHFVLSDKGCLIVSVPSDNFPVQQKHYRHYNKELLKKQAKGFDIEEVYYLVKGGLFYHLVNRLFGKFSSFRLIRKLLFGFAKKFLFEASENNAKHLVVRLRKK